MLRSLSAVSAIALLALWATAPNPASAQERLCNPVLDSSGEPVTQASGVVVHAGTYECPEEVVAAPPVVAPAAALPAATTVFFAFDKADLEPAAEDTLAGLISEVQNRELEGVVVQGHTDTAGPPEYNMELSQRRANTVAADLTKSGIPSEVIITEAFGETDLAVPTPDNTPNAENRRVVVDING
jgi:outer membrane protein OmpA-like peptidoglycan-associated protein